MARSSGTGIIVSLVVFVLTTVFLLILSIVFYTGKTKAEQSRFDAEATLGKYVTRAQRNDERIKTLENSVRPARNESVVKRLLDDRGEVMGFLSGDPSAPFETVQSEFQRKYQMPDDGSRSVSVVLSQMSSQLRSRQQEIDGLNATVNTRNTEIEDLEDRMNRAEEAHQEQQDRLREDLESMQAAVRQYREQLSEVVDEYYAAIAKHDDEYQAQVRGLEDEKDALTQDRAANLSRIRELRSIISKNRPKGDDPALLVDGRIIEAGSSANQVFIDRGRNDRIVLGMTFEVYDDASALQQADSLSDTLPRGKASLQVIKVAEATSTCKITRFVPGRPVVRDDVIANAIYDPTYEFKFMVHGEYDVNNDGRPTEAEADHVRSLVVDWGGIVYRGETLPGDLDFLVLGVEPPKPLPLRPGASAMEIQQTVARRLAYERYQDLFRQASEAQIPVLNVNRFRVLTGDTGR